MKKEKQPKKPKAKVIGQSKNVFNLLAICMTALNKANLHEQAKEMQAKILACSDYDEAIVVLSAYCELY